MNEFRTAIVGAGPAGLAAALTLSRSLQRSILFDSASAPRNAGSTMIGSLLGHDGIAPKIFRQAGRADIDRYGFVDFVNREVVRIAGDFATGFTLTGDDGSVVGAATVLLACGVVDCLPKIADFEQFWGKSIINCPFCDGYELRGGTWGVAVNRSEMLEVAEIYRVWCDDLILFIEPGIEIPAEREAELASKRIRVERRAMRRLAGDRCELRAVEMDDGERIGCRALVWWPFRRQTELIESLGLPLDSAGNVIVDDGCRAGRPGVYAAGDLIYADHQNTNTALHMGNKAAAAMVLDLAKRGVALAG